MTTVISTKGQIVLPAEIRREDNLLPGDEFEIERIDRGTYRLTRKARRRNAGLVKQLLACPARDWFQPMDRSDTTDEVAATRLK